MRRRRLTLSSTSGQIRRTAAASSRPTGVCTRSPGRRARRARFGAGAAARRPAGQLRGSDGLDAAVRSRRSGAASAAGSPGWRPAGARRGRGAPHRPAAVPTQPSGLGRSRVRRPDAAGPAVPASRPGPGRRVPAVRGSAVRDSGRPADCRPRAPSERARRRDRDRLTESRRSIRSSRCSSAPPSARRRRAAASGPTTSSSSSRGDVVPRISISPVCTMSAIRDSVAVPSRAAWSVIRSTWSGGASMRPLAFASGTASSTTRSRSRSSRSVGEPARVVPGLDHPVDRLVHRRGVAGRERVDHLVQQRAVGDAEQPDRLRVRHALRARSRR